MAQSNISQEEKDSALLHKLGYRQDLQRTLGFLSNFAVAFSYISVSTGTFSLFYLGLAAGGPAFFWTWPIVALGQFFVALNFAETSPPIFPLQARSINGANDSQVPRSAGSQDGSTSSQAFLPSQRSRLPCQFRYWLSFPTFQPRSWACRTPFSSPCSSSSFVQPSTPLEFA